MRSGCHRLPFMDSVGGLIPNQTSALVKGQPDVALGQKQTCAAQNGMSALPLKATEIADIIGFR